MQPSLEADYASCLKLARSHYENFPVASFFIPSKLRNHVAAVYAFARTADDFADEERDKRKRLKQLREWRSRLEFRLGAGSKIYPSLSLALPPAGEGILRAVAASVKGGFVPATELIRLLDAFEHDAQEKGYADMKDLLAYCRNSACSIGRILLKLFEVKDKKALAASDALCTALQLTNFWQDFSRDLPRKRLTLPRAEARRFGVPVHPGKIRGDEALGDFLRFLIDRTKTLYEKAEIFPSLVPPSLARQVRLTGAGGKLILSRVEKLGPRILETRPRLTWKDGPILLIRAFL